MVATHGMNIQEVEQLAARLREAANQIDTLTVTLDREVRGTPWAGPDAERFKGQWWPGHRSHLAAIGNDLRGFGQSAQNNASEQSRVSDSNGAPAAAGTVAGAAIAGAGAAIAGLGAAIARSLGATGSPGPTGGGSGAGGAGSAGAATGGALAANRVGASTGALPGADRSPGAVDAAYRQRGAELGVTPLYLPGGSSEYQCTAWANFRWAELRAEQGLDPVPPTSGNGGAMAGNAGGSSDTIPTLGAMISDQTEVPPYGHVMIAETITEQDGRTAVTVSEWNYGGSGADSYRVDRTMVLQDDGRWKMPNGSLRSLTVANLP